MTLPNKTSLAVAAMLALVTFAGALVPALLAPVALADALLVGLVLLDGLRLGRVLVEVRREDWKKVQIGREGTFGYSVENRSDTPLRVCLRQPWPPSFEAELPADAITVDVGPMERVRVALKATPRRRGRVALPPTEVDVAFSRGWARRRFLVESPPEIVVYPDLQNLVEYERLRRNRALSLAGMHRIRRVGAGREFEQLRDYLPDDDYRDINWRATARYRRPITNVYEVERSQDVMICLDGGRMMGDPAGHQTALDYAVDAAAMLAYACTRQGDRVGLAVFRDRVDHFLKPAGGVGTVTRMIDLLAGTASEPVFPSYAALAEALRSNCSHRGMVFIFTDLNDPQLAADLARVMPLISRRHITVVVSLRDGLLDRVADGPARTGEAVYEVLAARRLVLERQARERELTQHGVQVLQADADALSIEVINQYLAIRMRQLV